jgi:hypothetical protein
VPVVTKLGRNLDAGQGRTQYSDPVYGHETDDIIWQIRVQNTGTADLQDFTFDDVMDPGNYVINYVCLRLRQPGGRRVGRFRRWPWRLRIIPGCHDTQ